MKKQIAHILNGYSQGIIVKDFIEYFNRNTSSIECYTFHHRHRTTSHTYQKKQMPFRNLISLTKHELNKISYI